MSAKIKPLNLFELKFPSIKKSYEADNLNSTNSSNSNLITTSIKTIRKRTDYQNKPKILTKEESFYLMSISKMECIRNSPKKDISTNFGKQNTKHSKLTDLSDLNTTSNKLNFSKNKILLPCISNSYPTKKVEDLRDQELRIRDNVEKKYESTIEAQKLNNNFSSLNNNPIFNLSDTKDFQNDMGLSEKGSSLDQLINQLKTESKSLSYKKKKEKKVRKKSKLELLNIINSIFNNDKRDQKDSSESSVNSEISEDLYHMIKKTQVKFNALPIFQINMKIGFIQILNDPYIKKLFNESILKFK